MELCPSSETVIFTCRVNYIGSIDKTMRIRGGLIKSTCVVTQFSQVYSIPKWEVVIKESSRLTLERESQRTEEKAILSNNWTKFKRIAESFQVLRHLWPMVIKCVKWMSDN